MEKNDQASFSRALVPVGRRPMKSKQANKMPLMESLSSSLFLVCPLSDKKDSCETQFCHLKGVHLTPKIGHYLGFSVSVGPFHVPPNWLPTPLTAAGSSGEGSRGWVSSWALRAHSGPQWTLRGTGYVSALELLEDTDPWPLSLASEVPRASRQ